MNASFNNTTRANATNITGEDVKQLADLLIASAKLKNMPAFARIRFIPYYR